MKLKNLKAMSDMREGKVTLNLDRRNYGVRKRTF